MTFSELIAECRLKAGADESWSVEVQFWHHDHSQVLGRCSTSEEIAWVIFRHAGGCKRFVASTPEGVLALAFPSPVEVEQQAALVDAVEVQP